MQPARPDSGLPRTSRRAALAAIGRVTTGVAVAALLGPRAFAPSRARAASATTILYNSSGFTCEGATFAALDQGYFRDEGLDVTTAGVGSAAAELIQLAKGSADAMHSPAWTLAAPFLPPGVNVGDVVATVGLERGCASLLVPAGSPYRSLADLRGQKVAAPLPWHFIFGEPFIHAGLDPKKDIDWQPALTSAALGPALSKGEVAAAFAQEPYPAMLEASGAARALVVQDMPPMMMDYCCSALLSSALVSVDKVKAAAITRALMRGSAWINTHPTTAARMQVAGKHVPATLAENEASIASIAFVPSVADGRANTLNVFGRMAKLGFLDPSTNLESLTDQVFVPVTGDLPGSASGVAAGANPRSHATDSAGRALWATEHGGDSAGYDSASRADQITWNSVAIHGF